jgi:hypothetical protein
VLCRCLDLPWDDRLLRFHESAPARLEEHLGRPDASGRWRTTGERRRQQVMVMRPPDVTRIGRWRAALSPPERTRFEAEAGALLTELGYEV